MTFLDLVFICGSEHEFVIDCASQVRKARNSCNGEHLVIGGTSYLSALKVSVYGDRNTVPTIIGQPCAALAMPRSLPQGEG